MAHIIISVSGLGKRYAVNQIHYRGSLSRRLNQTVGRLWARRDIDPTSAVVQEIWALRDISFDVKQGEVVGVIGRNGSGKSTLMKILARITPPSEGTGEIFGRVGALLEVGTGFHPDLTGRENIFMSGAILGMPRRETERHFDEIVGFSEIGTLIDTPVRHYSSGMFMRLAFSVAAHLDAEIMLVDEVLAVGDGAFQAKCLNKIRETVRSGRTVLFISHDMRAIQDLCHWCIWLDRGEVRFIGPPSACIAAYEASFAKGAAAHPTQSQPTPVPDSAEPPM
ncbi:MAG TPA: ABC transporter ATP-binding protein [Stellaceae bacterium]|nr:ABC transporter ATP-binding protein [Stellaceae bacterium]